MRLEWTEVVPEQFGGCAQISGLPNNRILQLTAMEDATQYEVVILKEEDVWRMSNPMADVLFEASDMDQAKCMALKYEADFLETKADEIDRKINRSKESPMSIQTKEKEIDRLRVTAACLRAYLIETA